MQANAFGEIQWHYFFLFFRVALIGIMKVKSAVLVKVGEN
nr:hypothetical protein BSM_31550 [uncultured archaeon]